MLKKCGEMQIGVDSVWVTVFQKDINLTNPVRGLYGVVRKVYHVKSYFRVRYGSTTF
jgi:hypothetical protein